MKFEMRKRIKQIIPAAGLAIGMVLFPDAVNIASRLEGMNKRFNSEILISGDVHDGLSDPDRFSARKLGLVRIRGKEKPNAGAQARHTLPAAVNG
ncbi:MAG: hypothetical protein MUD12_06605 [Spirochaetes bacterium]|nr:hypothetical protein [Spirochaetota bacterium]